MPRLIFCLLACLGLSLGNLQAQKDLDDELYYWKVLSKVRFKTVIDEVKGDIYYKPVFGKTIESLEGKKIHLKGYMIPADLAGGRLTLSMFPFSSCYFCGQAGPETVVEIQAKTPLIYRMDKPIEVEGILHLNRDDSFRLIYVLKEAGYKD